MGCSKKWQEELVDRALEIIRPAPVAFAQFLFQRLETASEETVECVCSAILDLSKLYEQETARITADLQLAEIVHGFKIKTTQPKPAKRWRG